MRSKLTQHEILCALVDATRKLPDQPIRNITMGTCLAAVTSRFLGLASLVSHIAPGLPRPAFTNTPSSVHAVAGLLADPTASNTDKASLAMAAVNSLLPPPETKADIPGQDLILTQGQGKKVAVIGHFPFVDNLRNACDTVWVLEKCPKAGDIDASHAGEILPQADVVALTGTTLLNGTLAGLLNDCRENAFVIMMGPTTPFAASLFDCGIDILAGCAVPDPERALAGIRGGKCFKGLQGVRQIIWAKPGVQI